MLRAAYRGTTPLPIPQSLSEHSDFPFNCLRRVKAQVLAIAGSDDLNADGQAVEKGSFAGGGEILR
jgi:hypothetical protein